MTAPIKPGDLVMVVKPNKCCGDAKSVGRDFTVGAITLHARCECPNCWGFGRGTFIEDAGKPRTGELLSQVVKIDPPAEGDSLPTRQDMEITT